MNACPNCGMVKGLHASILPGCMCRWTPQEPVAWVSENAGLYHGKPDESVNPLPLYLALPPCQTCEALARTVMLDQTSHDATPIERKPLTDKQILADETLRYYFGQNGGAGPVSKQGRKVVNAIEALHGIKEVKSCGS